MKYRFSFLFVALAGLGCNSATTSTAPVTADGKTEEKTPVFKLAWSEYPSWSAFGVASEEGIIDGAEGKLGTVEKKYNVDIVLLQGDYDTTLTQYGSNTADAVCMTNMDSLAPSLRRKSVAIMPTSTSDGADAVISVKSEAGNFKDQIKGKTVYGLEKSVSEYLFHRLLEVNGVPKGDTRVVRFSNMDPAAAATAFQTKQNGIDAIVVWNPFLLQTLENRKDSVVVGDSTAIPMEIVDMVVVGQDSLDKPGGKNFAKAVCEAFYTFNTKLDDPVRGDEVLVALGAKFSNLDAKSMRTVVKQTKFFKTATDGFNVFTDKNFPVVMDRVAEFCVDRQIVDHKPTYAVNPKAGTDNNLVFTTEFMEAVARGK